MAGAAAWFVKQPCDAKNILVPQNTSPKNTTLISHRRRELLGLGMFGRSAMTNTMLFKPRSCIEWDASMRP